MTFSPEKAVIVSPPQPATEVACPKETAQENVNPNTIETPVIVLSNAEKRLQKFKEEEDAYNKWNTSYR